MKYMYFILYAVSFCVGVIGYKRGKHRPVVLTLLLLWMTFLMVFRYGQGTDYFSYNWLFQRYATYGSVQATVVNAQNLHGEVGFRIIGMLFDNHYEWFIALSSVYEMACLGYFLLKRCEKPELSFLLFVPTMGFVYYFSAIRQGLMIATFLAFGIDLIERRRWVRYVILVSLMAVFFHASSMTLLLIPLAVYLRLDDILTILLPIALVIGGIVLSGAFQSVLQRVPYIGTYFRTSGISYFAVAERLFSLIVILLLYLPERSADRKDPWWIKAYLICFVIYFPLIASATVSTRMIICYKAMEAMIVPNLLVRKHRFRQIAAVYFILLTAVLYLHNVKGSIDQGKYHEEINAVNYPYVSIFDREEIEEYREPDIYYPLVKRTGR